MANESTSWQNVGYYELGFDLQFGDTGPGYYGLDNIALDQYNTYPNQVVAIINTTEYWLGMMGLGIRPLNFTDSSQLTFLSTLASNRSAIPSFSYGYTAGAFYRESCHLSNLGSLRLCLTIFSRPEGSSGISDSRGSRPKPLYPD